MRLKLSGAASAIEVDLKCATGVQILPLGGSSIFSVSRRMADPATNTILESTHGPYRNYKTALKQAARHYGAEWRDVRALSKRVTVFAKNQSVTQRGVEVHFDGKLVSFFDNTAPRHIHSSGGASYDDHPLADWLLLGACHVLRCRRDLLSTADQAIYRNPIQQVRKEMRVEGDFSKRDHGNKKYMMALATARKRREQ